MMISDGSGMHALSIAIRTTTPPYPSDESTPVVNTARTSLIRVTISSHSTAAPELRRSPSPAVEDLVVGTAAVSPGRLRMEIAVAAVVPEPGAARLRRSGPVVGLDRDLPPATGQIHREVRDREPAGVAAQLLEDLDAARERRPEVPRALGEVARVQVVRADPPGEEPPVEIADGARRRVHATEQHRLVLHRDAVVHEPLAGLLRLGGALLRVVEVSDDEERLHAPEQRRQRVVD